MNCAHCGANLSLEDMKRPDCPYCRTALPHQARAAEHAALVNKVLEQRIGAQYPGMPPGQIPQIGYQYGAPMQPMQPMQGFDPFHQQQVGNALRRAGWITAVAVIVPLVIMMLVGAGVAVFMFAR